MARLTVPPQRRVTQETTPPPTTFSDASNDNEAATQQLLDEVRASASKSSRRLQSSEQSQSSASSPPKSSAVLGANLLNAARIEYRHSSPIRMAPKSSNGRLPRIGLFTEPRRQNLARPRQRDVYEFPDESPEKRPYKLHEMVNQKPLKIVRKKKAQKVTLSSDDSPSRQGHVPEPGGTGYQMPMPSSPPRANNDTPHAIQNGVEIAERLPNGAVRCSMTFYRYDKHGSRYEQCHNAGPHGTNEGPRCTRHVEKSGAVRCDYVISKDDDEVQCLSAAYSGKTRCAKHVGLVANASARKRTSEDNDEADAGASKLPKVNKHATAGRKGQNSTDNGASITRSNPQVQIPTREKRRGRPAKQQSLPRRARSIDEEEVTESIEITASATSGSKQRKKSQGRDAPNDNDPNDEQDSEYRDQGDNQDQANSDEDEPEDEDAEGAQPTNVSIALHRAFKYLSLEQRPGRCQTELCSKIKNVCDAASRRLRRHDLDLNEMAEIIENVQLTLNDVRNVPEKDREAVKADMYGYVFRSLMKVLRSLHGCWDEGAETLEAARLLKDIVHHIVVVKDLMASWKVTVPQHSVGDRLIAEVNSHLIKPLREAENVLMKRLRQIENKQRVDQSLASVKQSEEALQEEERLSKRREQYERWQRLHIARISCETRVGRRFPNLVLIKLEDEFEETDANGVRFQRLPVFRNRRTPPGCYRLPDNKLKPWSDEQAAALLDGLQEYAGPNAFENIFKAYCRPGGLLQDFRVLDIVSKAADLRSRVFEYYQEDPPEWAKQIPILP